MTDLTQAPYRSRPLNPVSETGGAVTDQAGPRPAVSAGRRCLNVTAAIGLILVSLPLWLLIAVLIKLSSRGPVLYTQTRIGLDKRRGTTGPDDPRRRNDLGGRPFTIYKFRTMYEGAEHGVGEVWASRDDPRVTAVGRWLRLYRLDELPQLLNVLRGEMNLVGPRPERPSIVAELRQLIPHYQRRHRTLPGITGRAQVSLRYDASLDDVREKLQHDIAYIGEASAWTDFKIMLRTIPVVLFRRGSH